MDVDRQGSGSPGGDRLPAEVEGRALPDLDVALASAGFTWDRIAHLVDIAVFFELVVHEHASTTANYSCV